VKQGIAERSKELSSKVLTNILVLATVAKDPEGAAKEAELDLWDSVENSVIVKMREMELGDLVNLMWSALEVNKGSRTFFSELEKELKKRILKVQDEEYSILIGCLTKENNPISNNNFTERFVDIVLGVIQQKKDRFQLRTLVHIIWALAKIDFSSDSVLDILKDLKTYPRL